MLARHLVAIRTLERLVVQMPAHMVKSTTPLHMLLPTAIDGDLTAGMQFTKVFLQVEEFVKIFRRIVALIAAQMAIVKFHSNHFLLQDRPQVYIGNGQLFFRSGHVQESLTDVRF